MNWGRKRRHGERFWFWRWTRSNTGETRLWRGRRRRRVGGWSSIFISALLMGRPIAAGASLSCSSPHSVFLSSFHLYVFTFAVPSVMYREPPPPHTHTSPPPIPPPPHAASANNVHLLQATRPAYWMSPCCTFFSLFYFFTAACTRTQLLEWGDK